MISKEGKLEYLRTKSKQKQEELSVKCKAFKIDVKKLHVLSHIEKLNVEIP